MEQFGRARAPRGPFRWALTLAVGLSAATAFSRTVTCLDSFDWTCDGAPVTLPHTWNAADGADGDPDGRDGVPRGCDSLGAESFVRKAATYRVRLPSVTAGKRYFLRFEAVSQKAAVRVNGKLVGTHQGAFTAFCHEITGALDFSAAATNALEVVADNRFDPDVPPWHGDFTPQGGIYRSVWLVETERVCIDPTRFGGPGVTLDADAESGVVTARVFVSGGTNETQRIVIPNHRLWSPDEPVVYEAVVAIDQFGCTDSVRIPFAFRTVEFRADGFFYLNGRKTVLRGVNRHQDVEGRGWALSRADEETDVRLIREMGANAVRTAHYPQSDAFYSACDRQGLLAWCELSCLDATTSSATYRANVANMQREMVAQLGHHPSIAMWSVFNELYNGDAIPAGTAEPVVAAANDLFRLTDPSRPTVAATCKVDKLRLNAIPQQLALNLYPGWYGKDETVFGDRVDRARALNGRTTLGVSEYGAGASVNHHGDPLVRCEPKGRIHNEERQVRVCAENYRCIVARDWIWGSFVWVFNDFASDARREGERDGINDKGLVTRDRKTLKDAYYLYRANWTTNAVCRLVGARRRTWAGGRTSVMAISNVGPVTLYVNGKSVGTAMPDEVKTVLWRDVELPPGENRLEVRADGRRTGPSN